MKMYILSDRSDTLAGMRLAGIEGSLVRSGEELGSFLKKADFSDVAVLMITKSLADMNRPLVNSMKRQNRPLLVEVPDRENCSTQDNSITEFVREAMGIKL